MWTIEKVKEQLPDIKVDNVGRNELWRVGGIANEFAIVYNPRNTENVQAAWGTVVKVLNNNSQLIVL